MIRFQSARATSLKILFFVRSPANLRNFDSSLRLLAQRGHAIRVVFDPVAGGHPQLELLDALSREHERVSYCDAPSLAAGGWFLLATRVRFLLDYLRYLTPEFAGAEKLRERVEVHLPGAVRRVVLAVAGHRARGRRTVAAALRAVERSVPLSGVAMRFLQAEAPDVVAVTPLVQFSSPQVEYVRAARALRIPTVLCVHSWDNLTSKGLIHEPTDRVAVWNELQRDEAIALHDIDPASVCVTGAPSYDHWFDWSASRSRAEFCAEVGLDPGAPIILYVCSSSFIAPHEDRFVERWLAALRARPDALLRDANVMVRPHPAAAEAWQTNRIAGEERVVVWPPGGADPADPAARADYFDSMHHAAAIVGVNTSALLEGVIVGRPVYVAPAAEFRGTQQGTLHFRYLLTSNGGPIRPVRDLAEHLDLLSAGIAPDREPVEQRDREFVASFIRPRGMQRSATEALVHDIERSAASPAGASRGRPTRAPLMRTLLRPFVLYLGYVRPWLLAARDRLVTSPPA